MLPLPDLTAKLSQDDLRDRQAALSARRADLKGQLATVEAEQIFVARLSQFHLPRQTSPAIEQSMKRYVLEAFIALAVAHQDFKAAQAAQDLINSL